MEVMSACTEALCSSTFPQVVSANLRDENTTRCQTGWLFLKTYIILPVSPSVALGQIMLYVDGMNGLITHNETVQWLYTLAGSKVRNASISPNHNLHI